MVNAPNVLSMCRILAAPILVVILLTKFENKEFYGLAVFLLAALTDFLDGYLARRNQQITALGKLLDPAADKILTSAAFISLVEVNPTLTPAWIVALIVSREFAVGALRSVAAAQGVVIAASMSGKVKTVTQVIAISLLIFHNQLHENLQNLDLASWALWLALVATVYSGIDYFLRFRRLVLAPIQPALEIEEGTPGDDAPTS